MFKVFFILLLFSTQSLFAENAVKIGVLLPLSGPLASAGHALEEGIQLASSNNQNKLVEFIFDDHQYSPAQTITALKKMTDNDKIQALMIFGGPPSMAIKKIVEDKHLPTISFSATLQLEEGNGSIVRIWESANDIASLILEACKKLEAKKIALISTENDATLSIKSEILKGIKIAPAFEEEITLGEQDFRSLASRIRNAHPDLIISNILAGQHSQLISKLKEQGIVAPIILQSSVFFDTKSRAPYPKVLDGAIVATVDDSKAEKFYELLSTKGSNSNAVYMSAIGFDSANFLIAAINTGWKFTTPIPISSTEGILGHYHRPRETSLKPPMRLLKFTDGKLIPAF